MSVVRPGCAPTRPPIFPIGQATKKPANRRVVGKGEGGKMMQYCSYHLFPTASFEPLVAHTLQVLNTFALFLSFWKNFSQR